MTTRVWLKGEVLKSSRITRRNRMDRGVSCGEILMLDGVDLRCEGGCYYLELPEVATEIPTFLDGFVYSVSIVTFNAGVRREQGIYSQDGATGEVILHIGGTQEIKVCGTADLAKAQDLLDNIREGKIRPVRSFDGPQNGLSAVEAGKKIVQLQAEIEGYKSQVMCLEGENARKDLKIAELTAPWWRRLNKWVGEVWGG
jgi:hypothetical protein